MAKINGVSEEYYVYLNLITRLYGEEWKGLTDKITKRKLSDDAADKLLYHYMPLMYRRWYFSSFIEDTALTPANLVIALNREFGVPDHVTPRLTYRLNEKGEPGAAYELTVFDPYNHPLINDLKYFLENISPTFDMSAPESWELPGLSLSDCEYRLFLMNTLISLSLIKKMPSITNTIAMKNNSEELLAFSWDLEPEIIYRKILDAVLEHCVESLAEILPLGRSYKKKLLSYLKETAYVDQIFSEIFECAGLSVDDFFDDDEHGEHDDVSNALFAVLAQNDLDDAEGEEELQSMRAGLMSGAFFIGIILDRDFLTPLAYYCRFIQLLYVLPYNLEEELDNILDFLERDNFPDRPEDSDIKIDIYKEMAVFAFAPCTAYQLTELGGKVVGAPAGHAEVFTPGVSIKQVISSLKELRAHRPAADLTGDVVTLKITPRDDREYWQNVEILADTPLLHLHMFFTAVFGIDSGLTASFFHGDKENPFIEYTNRPKKQSAKKSARAPRNERTLSAKFSAISLDGVNQNDSFLYILHSQFGQILFDIKIMKKERKKPENLPRVLRRGKGFSQDD